MKAAFVSVLLAVLALSGSGRSPVAAQGAGDAGADLRGRSVLAEAAAQSLGDRLHDRPLGGRAGQRLDDPSTEYGRRQFQGRRHHGRRRERPRRRSAAGRRAERADIRADADRQVLQGGAAGACLRSGRQSGEVVGRAGPGLRLAGQQPRHHRRSSRQRLAGGKR